MKNTNNRTIAAYVTTQANGITDSKKQLIVLNFNGQLGQDDSIPDIDDILDPDDPNTNKGNNQNNDNSGNASQQGQGQQGNQGQNNSNQQGAGNQANNQGNTQGAIDDADAKRLAQIELIKSSDTFKDSNETEVEAELTRLTQKATAENKTIEEIIESEKVDGGNGGNNNDDTPEPFVKTLQKTFGYEIKDEQGKVKEYEDTEEGLIEYNKDVVQAMLIEKENEFFTPIPDAKRYAQHLMAGGTRDNFFSQKDYTKVDADPTKHDELSKKQIIIDNLVAKGTLPEKAKKIADFYTQAEDLDIEFKDALAEHIKRQTDADTANATKIAAQVKQQEERTNAHWSSVNELVNKGEISGIIIPEAERKAFYAYLAVDVDGNGRSQEMIDRSKEDLAVSLKLSYLRYKNFDISKLVAKAAGTANAQTLRERINKSNQGGQGAGTGNGNNTTKGSIDDFDLNKM